MDEEQNKHLWWQKEILYQVYPRSFQDSNEDGIGDLSGILHRLDYLKWLGVKAVWISPFYPSPMADFGYDIADYTGIDSIFGSMVDFDELLKAIHKRNMKLILDFVPNHTSDKHPWFEESRSSSDNPKRDWYIWEDADENGEPPNNWRSVFGGSGWEWDDKTEQFYYHAFLKEQPDLNWRNPEVQEAMFDVMRFWLDKGVDGFRVDVMWHMIKDKKLRDNPQNPNYEDHMSDYDQLLPTYSTDQPEVHEIVNKMRDVLDGYNERMMIGEIYLPIDRLVSYYGIDNKGAHLPFNFLLLSTAWDAKKIASAIDEYEGALPSGGWPNWVLGNHDQTRIVSRVGMAQAKVAAMLLLTLRGTPTIYYGDEIGMRCVAIPFEDVQDPQGLNMPDKNLSRDPSRTPMQWDNSKNAGFSSVEPWLPMDPTYKRVNVKAQQEDSYSYLKLYKKLIDFRQEEPSLMIGDYVPVHADNQMLVFIREFEGHHKLLIVLNLSHRPAYYKPKGIQIKGVVEVATLPELEGNVVEGNINLSGDEGVIVRLS